MTFHGSNLLIVDGPPNGHTGWLAMRLATLAGAGQAVQMPEGRSPQSMFKDVADAADGRRTVVTHGGAWRQDMPAADRRMLERTCLTATAVVIDAWRESPSLFSDLLLRGLEHRVLAQDSAKAAALVEALGLVPNEGPGSGAWRPGRSLLIACDGPNTAKAGTLKHRLPYVSFGEGKSREVADILERTKLSERELYWVNVQDCEGAQTDGRFLRDLRPRGAVAMGDRSERWLKDYGVKILGRYDTKEVQL